MYKESERVMENPVVIPGWFVKITGAVIGLLLPWAAWMTLQVVTIGVKLDIMTQASQEVDILRAEYNDHISNPILHESGFKTVEVEIADLERRIVRLESRAIQQ